MRITISVIKADVGSIGGHTKPTPKMIDAAKKQIADAIQKGLLIDGMVTHTGDDIALLMTHTHGSDNSDVHLFAWDTFLKATENFKFVIITDTTDIRLEAICEDNKIALILIDGGVIFEELVPYFE